MDRSVKNKFSFQNLLHPPLNFVQSRFWTIRFNYDNSLRIEEGKGGGRDQKMSLGNPDTHGDIKSASAKPRCLVYVDCVFRQRELSYSLTVVLFGHPNHPRRERCHSATRRPVWKWEFVHPVSGPVSFPSSFAFPCLSRIPMSPISRREFCSLSLCVTGLQLSFKQN